MKNTILITSDRDNYRSYFPLLLLFSFAKTKIYIYSSSNKHKLVFCYSFSFCSSKCWKSLKKKQRMIQWWPLTWLIIPWIIHPFP